MLSISLALPSLSWQKKLHDKIDFDFGSTLLFPFSANSSASSSPPPSYRPRDGGWGSWSSWYSAYCSGGYKTVRRSCNNPSPAYGGSYCYGSSTESRDCNECNNYNGGCAHSCTNTYGSYRCTCYSGFRRNPYNWKKCVCEYLFSCSTLTHQ